MARKTAWRNPSKVVVLGFAGAILAGALLLMLPASTTGDGNAPFLKSVFTATSAICVTGLAIVDTATYWTPFGQGVILALIQIGGIGIMTGASLLLLVVSKRLGLKSRILASQEGGTINLGDVRNVLLAVLGFTVVFEVVGSVALTLRFWADDGTGFTTALWEGVFHSVSAFNNAGLALFSNSMMDYRTDTVMTLILSVLVTFGGLGFPVWLELRRRWHRPSRWSLHTKLTLVVSGAALVSGWVFMTALEWGNERTLGTMSVGHKLVAGFFASAVSRTAGFNSIDYGQVNDETLMVTNVYMFLGGGSGSTAGGIKFTTFAVLILMAMAEMRGHSDVTAFGRRVGQAVQRQAVTVVVAATVLVIAGAVALMAVSPASFDDVLFESVSAVATVGLSPEPTTSAGAAGQVILSVLMYLGRIGPLTLAVALILRQRPRRYHFPEERPIVG